MLAISTRRAEARHKEYLHLARIIAFPSAEAKQLIRARDSIKCASLAVNHRKTVTVGVCAVAVSTPNIIAIATPRTTVVMMTRRD